MSIFDNILPEKGNNNKPYPLQFSSESAAFIGILYACTEDDIERGDAEIEAILRVSNTKPSLQNINFKDVITEYYHILNLLGVDALLIIAISQLSDDNKKSVLINCFDLVFVNSNVDKREMKFIDNLIRCLGVESEFVDNVSEIIKLKFC